LSQNASILCNIARSKIATDESRRDRAVWLSKDQGTVEEARTVDLVAESHVVSMRGRHFRENTPISGASPPTNKWGQFNPLQGYVKGRTGAGEKARCGYEGTKGK
jgi:hypothetical protein